MTSTLSRMRQIEERQVEHEVKLLEWSPKMDILAVGLFNGDVSLHRLNWQKIWTVSSPEECTCEALSWRPDGKVLAVGFSNGEVRFYISQLVLKELLERFRNHRKLCLLSCPFI